MTQGYGPRTIDHGPRWLHYWAILTACATLPLLLLGAEVTTKKVGMVDQAWPTYPWHLLLVSWRESGLGYLIEHAHRLLGYTVGCCAIVLTVGLWLREPRRWVRWLGTAALVGVCVQGVLGGMRVLLNPWVGPELAMIHGFFAQVVVGLLVSVAVVTARSRPEMENGAAARLRIGALLLLGLVILQIALGGWLRHRGGAWGQRGHFLMAFAVVAAVAWLAHEVFGRAGQPKQLRWAMGFLVGLVALQLGLGVESWLIRFQASRIPPPEAVRMVQDLIRSAHYVVGSLVFAGSLVLTLRTWARRPSTDDDQPAEEPSHCLEGVA